MNKSITCNPKTHTHTPVYEVFFLQILHGRGDLSGHVQQHHGVDLLAVALPQVVQQVAVGHELRDDVEGRLPRAHACADTRTRMDAGTDGGEAA